MLAYDTPFMVTNYGARAMVGIDVNLFTFVSLMKLCSCTQLREQDLSDFLGSQVGPVPVRMHGHAFAQSIQRN